MFLNECQILPFCIFTYNFIEVNMFLLFWKKERGFWLKTQEDPDLASSDRHTKSIATYGTISFDKNKHLKTGRATPSYLPIKRKPTLEQVGKAET